MRIKDVILKTRTSTGRDLTADEETMINNAYLYGSYSGKNEIISQIRNWAEDKIVKSPKVKEFDGSSERIQYGACEYCEREFPKSSCCSRFIGEDDIVMCDECLSYRMEIGLIEKDSDRDYCYFYTTEGKYFRIGELESDVAILQNKINSLNLQIEHNCKDGDEYYELVHGGLSNSWDNEFDE